MKLYFRLTIFSLLCSLTSLLAQTKANIVDELNAPKAGQGTVKVYIDDNIKGLIGTSAASTPISDIDTTQTRPSGIVVKRMGFKIQVFSGNDQRKSKNEAYYKQGQIRNQFPDIDTVVSFHSPFWRLRAGNYKTYSEAAHAMSELKRELPTLGKEMYVVKDMVNIIE